MHIKTVVLTSEPFEFDTQTHIRPLLDALNSVSGLVDADSFLMTLDHSNIDQNEIKIVLEFANCVQPIAYKVRRKNDGVEYGPFETLAEANEWIGTHGHNELICIYPGQEMDDDGT